MLERSKDRLALLGGTPVNSSPPPRYNTIGEAEKRAVMEVLDSGELSGFVASPNDYFWGGRAVRALEEAFRKRFKVKHAISVNSATSGLHCAVAATRVGPGDEVVCSPYTMSASGTAILMTGAVPVFADIEDETFGLDPASVEAAITPHTRGIMVTNIFGHAARLDPLRAIADRHKLFLIEDCAQSPGAIYRGRDTGTIGHMGVFSFNRHKTMQSGEGGVVITDDDDLALRVALFRNHGEVVVDSFNLDDITNTTGLNLRMTEMEAAVGRVQFERLAELTDKRIALVDRLMAGLAEIPGLTPPVTAPDCKHVYYVGAIKYDAAVSGLPRELFTRALSAEGFAMRAGYIRPLYLQPVYQQKKCMGPDGFPFSANPRAGNLSYAKGICPVTERLQDSDLMLTDYFYPPLTQADMTAFVEACEKVLRHRDDLLAAKKRAEI